MAGVTTKTSIDQAVEKFLAESRFTLQERPGVMKSSIRNETLPENEGPSVNIPKYGTVSVYALTEGVDMTQAQEITDTGMVITPAEFGGQVVLSDMMLDTVKDEFFRVAGRLLADGWDRQQDQTLCDDCDNFSVALGSASTALLVGHVMAGEEQLRGQTPANGTAGRGGEPAPMPYSFVAPPAMLHTLRKSLSMTYENSQDRLTQKDSIPGSASGQYKIAGLESTIKTDINFNKDTSDDVKAGLFSEQSMILVTLSGGPKAEKERDASLRAWEVNFVGRWARGEYNDGWGREMLFDAARPTS